MSNHLAGSEVATATYRILGPVLGRLLPPWRPIRVVPEGLCSWGDLWKVSLVNGAVWQLPMGLRSVPGHGRIARLTGAAAQAGGIHCPGMEAATGQLVWIPAAAWGTTPTYGKVSLPPERAAISGRLLRIPGDPGVVVEPLMLLRDLALFLGAANPPPPPPRRVLDAIAEPGPGRRPRRRNDGGEAAPALPDAREIVPGAGGDHWHQEDEEIVFGHHHSVPSGFGSTYSAFRPRSGSNPSDPDACGSRGEEVRPGALDPRPHGPSADVGRAHHREPAVDADAGLCSGRPTDCIREANPSPMDECGVREPSANQPDFGEAACGRPGATEDQEGCDGGAVTLTQGLPAAGTGSSPMAFGTGSEATRKARGGRKTGSPAKADHLLFPKAGEWMREGRSFATVTDLCGRLAEWLEETHGEKMAPGSIEGAFRRRGKYLLDEICPPPARPLGTLPNGRPRASGATARD